MPPKIPSDSNICTYYNTALKMSGGRECIFSTWAGGHDYISQIHSPREGGKNFLSPRGEASRDENNLE